MKENKTIEDIRRTQLKIFIDKKFDTIAEFAIALGINRNNVSTLLNGKRPFSDATAYKIESVFALPPGYLSIDGNKEHIATEFIDVDFYEDMKDIASPNFKKQIRLTQQLLTQFDIEDFTNLIATKMNNELMYPTISKGEFVVIDASQKTLEKNKLYLFKVDNIFQIRRVINFDKKIVTIHIDNENEKKYLPDNISLSNIEVIGRLIGGMKSYN